MSARLNKFKVKSLKLKVILPFLLFTLYFLLISPAHAAPLSSQNFNYLINGQTTLDGSVGQWAICGVIGRSPLNDCSGYQATDGKPATNADAGGNSYAKVVVLDHLPNGGALGATGGLMASLYQNPPVSSGYYLANLGQEFGLVRPAFAANSVAGSGDGILRPVYQLWQVTRNLAYAAFIIVIIVVGFMIMLRQRINPQTVVSIQQAIPSIVIGLALVTISYFIASLILDLAFVGTQVVTSLFANSGLNNIFGQPGEISDMVKNASFLGFFKTAAINGNAFGTIFGGLFGQTLQSFGAAGSAIPGIIGAIAGAVVFGLPGAIAGGVGGLSAPVLIPIVVIIILIFALLIQVVRLAFALISAYIELLVLTIAGPFYILWGSIPGRGGAITYWIRGLLANTLIFPAVVAGFLFAGVILGNTDNNTIVTLPLFGGLQPNFIRVLIAYGILLGLPSIPNLVRQAFRYQGPQGVAQAAIAGGIAGYTMAQPLGTAGYRGGVQGLYDLTRPYAGTPGDWRGRLATRIGRRFGNRNNPWFNP